MLYWDGPLLKNTNQMSLANNSEDEKRIARAEKEAERKALKRKKRFADGQSFEEQ